MTTKEMFDEVEENNFERLLDIYIESGEKELANAMHMSHDELDHLINETGFEHGLHADDNREVIVTRVILEYENK